MSDPINVRVLPPGTRIALADGAVAEIVSNPADGVWLFARYVSSPSDPALPARSCQHRKALCRRRGRQLSL